MKVCLKCNAKHDAAACPQCGSNAFIKENAASLLQAVVEGGAGLATQAPSPSEVSQGSNEPVAEMSELPPSTILHCASCQSVHALLGPTERRCPKCSAPLGESKYRYVVNDARLALLGVSIAVLLVGLSGGGASAAQKPELPLIAWPALGIVLAYTLSFAWMSIGLMRGGLQGDLVRARVRQEMGSAPFLPGMFAWFSWMVARLRYDPPLPWLRDSLGARLLAEVFTILKIGAVVAIVGGVLHLLGHK
jgi:RNA polymerase subunit RPABC4/transcription elongation factor Spt4